MRRTRWAAIILPGTKNSVDDLRWLYARGLAGAIDRLARARVPVIGICGGYQMLGHAIYDADGLESHAGVTPGLGLLPVTGYEIHMGRTRRLADAPALFTLADGTEDGCISGEVWGTYLHYAILEGDRP